MSDSRDQHQEEQQHFALRYQQLQIQELRQRLLEERVKASVAAKQTELEMKLLEQRVEMRRGMKELQTKAEQVR